MYNQRKSLVRYTMHSDHTLKIIPAIMQSAQNVVIMPQDITFRQNIVLDGFYLLAKYNT